MCVVDAMCTFAAWFVFKVSALVAMHIQRSEPDGRKRIIVFANQAIGDTIIKLPFFFALRKNFPPDKYRISVVLSSKMASSYSRLGCFDDVIAETISPCRHVFFWVFGRTFFPSKSLRWAFCNKADVFIACDKYRDVGIDFARCLSRPAVSVAYDTGFIRSVFPMTARYQRVFHDRKYSFLLESSSTRHQIDDMFSLLSLACGRDVRPSPVSIDMLGSLLDFSILDASGLLNAEYSVLIPGARVSYRRWQAEKFAAVAKVIGGMFVVVGTSDEAPLAATISAAGGIKVVDMCGKTDIRQMLGILSKAKIVIGNETGTTNCAAMLGAKTICILGGGAFGSFFPNGYCPNAISVFHKEKCFACGWRCSKRVLGGTTIAPCIDSITVEDVMSAVSGSNIS